MEPQLEQRSFGLNPLQVEAVEISSLVETCFYKENSICFNRNRC